jgi:hypothetical protein
MDRRTPRRTAGSTVEFVPGASLELQGALIEVPYGSLQFGADGNIVMARSQAVLLASASAADEAEGQRDREGNSDTVADDSADAAGGAGNPGAVRGSGAGEAGEGREARGAGGTTEAEAGSVQ